MAALVELFEDSKWKPKATASVPHPHLALIGLDAIITINITFATDTPFYVECIEQSRRRMIVIKPIGFFPFTALPPELRTKVNEMLFDWVTDFTIHGLNYVAVSDVPERFIAVQSAPSAVSVLQANRQIHQEAIRMLYTKKRFHFDNTYTLDTSLHRIGDAATLLSNITIFDRFFDFHPNAGFGRLIGATKLQSIHLGENCFKHLTLTRYHPTLPFPPPGPRIIEVSAPGDEVAFSICSMMKTLFRHIDAREGRLGAGLEKLSLQMISLTAELRNELRCWN